MERLGLKKESGNKGAPLEMEVFFEKAIANRVVELRNVSMCYIKGIRRERFSALQSINLEINCGETVGFIGNNGAGKSTAIRIILGLQKPTSGFALLNGRSTIDPLARHRVAYVPESPYLYDYLTPLELLSIGFRMHHSKRFDTDAAMDFHCMKWLERFRIADVAKKRIRSFSKGMTQRTALAHALACEPDFLILDEPLSGLDPLGRLEVVEILDEYRMSGRTLFFSSHVLNDVERLADRFIFLHKGVVRAVHATSDLNSGYSPSFEVTVEGGDPGSGFSQISSRLWRREVESMNLVHEIQKLISTSDTFKGRLYSVRNLNGLERAYANFVRNAERDT